MRRQVRQVWALIPRRERWIFALTACLQIAAAMLEIATIGVVYAFLAIAINPADTSNLPGFVKRLIALTPTDGSLQALAVLAIILFVVRTTLSASAIIVQQRFQRSMLRSLSVALMRNYLFAPYREHLDRRSGHMVNNVTTNTTNVVAYCIIGLLELLTSSVILCLFFLSLALAEPILTVAVGGAVVVLVVFYFLIMRRRLQSWGEGARRASAALFSEVNEIFGAFKAIKADSAELFFLRRFEARLLQTASLLLKINIFREAPRLFLELLGVGGILIVMLIALTYDHSGQRLVATLAAFGLVFIRAMPHVARLVSYAQLFNVGRPLVEAVYADLVAEQAGTAPRPPPASLQSDFQGWSTYALENLSFAYEPGRRVLANVDLTVRRGALVGLVGPSGSGKTTIVDLLLGLMRPDSGRVVIDGQVIPDRSALSRFCAYVPQEPFILDTSLERNIAFASDEARIDHARLDRAIADANLDGVVRRLPRGVETVLGERGNVLSVGERQRVGIARALYKDAEVIILDEPTAAQDAGNEAELMRTLHALRGRKTLIVVAHRVNSLKAFDEIYMFDHGRVVAAGTFAELIARSDAFRGMVKHFSAA